MRSIVSTPRVEPIRQGVHLPQLSTAQNSIAKRAMCAMSTLSSNTVMPAWPIRPPAGGEGLIVERQVEHRRREIGAERPADLHRAHRPAALGAAADLVDQLAERDAEADLEQPAVPDIAGELDRHRPARSAEADRRHRPRAPSLEDERHRRQAQHIVDHRRLAEQPDMRRQRRLGADLAALALDRIEQRGLLAADIGAGADPHLERERRDDVRRRARSPRCIDADRERIFRADIDIAVLRADRVAGDRHALDQAEGIALHQHAVGEGAAVALVGVADDEFSSARRIEHGLPFDPGRKARAAAPAQAGVP